MNQLVWCGPRRILPFRKRPNELYCQQLRLPLVGVQLAFVIPQLDETKVDVFARKVVVSDETIMRQANEQLRYHCCLYCHPRRRVTLQLDKLITSSSSPTSERGTKFYLPNVDSSTRWLT